VLFAVDYLAKPCTFSFYQYNETKSLLSFVGIRANFPLPTIVPHYGPVCENTASIGI
jgi:hypothetical protein